MTSAKNIKVVILLLFTLALIVWVTSGTLSKASGSSNRDSSDSIKTESTPDPNLYIGSEACATCHEPQFKSVSDTKHGKLANLKDWKDKVQSCEACHGPGKAHAE